MTEPVFSPHFETLWDSFTIAAIIVAAIVFGIMAWLVVSFRAKADYDIKRDSPFIPGVFPAERDNFRLEVTWFIIPLAIVVWLTVITLGPLSEVWPSERMIEEKLNEGESIQYVSVVAEKWQWWYFPTQDATVLGNGSDPTVDAIVSEEEMRGEDGITKRYAPEITLQCNQHVMFYLYSYDVLHGFYIPEAGIKEDVVPGLQTKLYMKTPDKLDGERLNEFWPDEIDPEREGLPRFIVEDGNGTYHLQLKCTEYCGDGHSVMLGTIKVTGYNAAGICGGA